jgi:hypothetical protein
MEVRLWDPDSVLAISYEIRDRAIACMRQLAEFGEGPDPSIVIDDMATELNISRELLMGVMLAGQLIDTDRLLNELSPEEREDVKRYMAEEEADMDAEIIRIQDELLAARDERDEQVQLLREIFELESGEE